MTPDSTSLEHQYSFYEDSFDFLLEEGLVETVESRIISFPGAWGYDRRQKITHRLDNLLRKITGKPLDHELMQIIFDMKTTK